MKVAFSRYATTIQDLMDIADAGKVSLQNPLGFSQS